MFHWTKSIQSFDIIFEPGAHAQVGEGLDYSSNLQEREKKGGQMDIRPCHKLTISIQNLSTLHDKHES